MNEFFSAPRPIRTVLVANRGEITCRIVRTCRRLGLRTVAIHSEADAGAMHVRAADHSVCVGPAPASESYLSIPAVIAAAKASGADAIHPGYGFLSENAAFVEACEAAGLVFVGPSETSVSKMGSKVAARRSAEEAGVPVVPGFNETHATTDDLVAAARKIGFPVMVKANSGGGGRGMRRVASAEDLPAALASAKAEALSAFGDDGVFLEKLIERPRHLEVQVFGDGRGGVLHFHERDCSVQRNHQKVIEEAPAPGLDDEVRSKLFESAIRLAGAMAYAGAGTVEFIMDAAGRQPYFLEMNTRLQVEHPVTEEICGIDLVELQLRQAAGLPLHVTQDRIAPRGHSIEVRINAERPESGFLPATGTLGRFDAPPRVRIDTGVGPGSTVGSHYDSMLAKAISHGPDRETARLRLVEALRALSITGVATNQRFLIDCLEAPSFAEGRATTAFIEETFPDGWAPDPGELRALRAAAALAAREAPPDDPLRRADGWRVTRGRRAPCASFLVSDDYGEEEIVITMSEPPAVALGEGRIRPLPTIVWSPVGDGVEAASGGLSIAATVQTAVEGVLGAKGAGSSEGSVSAPLTGLVTAVHVKEGQDVAAGDRLLDMEAMKLVHTLKAPVAGRIARVGAKVGETVKARTVLIEIEGGS